ncbi:MAG: CHAT domain-containing protein, partial [Candidatus Eremiobacterota bacterium]
MRLDILAADGGALYKFRLRPPGGAEVTRSAVLSQGRRWRILKSLGQLAPFVGASPFHIPRPERGEAAARTLGELMGALIPTDIVQELQQQRDRARRLELAPESCLLPWELARPVEGMCLAEAFTCTRFLGARPTGAQPLSGSLRALLVLDPERLQSWYQEEASAIMDSLGPAWKFDLLSGPQATVSGVRAALDQGRCGLCHILAYADAAVESPDLSRIHLADGALRPLFGRTHPPAAPRLVCLHFNVAGEAQPGCPGMALANTWATAFGALGTETVLVTQWELPSDLTRSFFSALYRGLSRGDSLASALQAARSVVAQRGGTLASQAVVAYGPLDWKAADL